MPVHINYHLCEGCKSCYTHCPADVIGWDEEREIPYITYQEECSHCGVCKMECSRNAIELTLPLAGWIDMHKRFISKLSTPMEIRWPEDN